jgi:hypothetical protein
MSLPIMAGSVKSLGPDKWQFIQSGAPLGRGVEFCTCEVIRGVLSNNNPNVLLRDDQRSATDSRNRDYQTPSPKCLLGLPRAVAARRISHRLIRSRSAVRPQIPVQQGSLILVKYVRPRGCEVQAADF